MDDQLTVADDRFLRIGDRIVDFERSVVMRDGEALSVEPKPLKVLAYLHRNRSHPVSVDELKREVWGLEVVDEAVQRAVSLLRQWLDRDGEPSVIETIPRKGYILRSPVSPTETAEALRSASKWTPREMSLLLVAVTAAIAVLLLLMLPRDAPAPPAPDADSGVNRSPAAAAPPAPD